MRLKQREVARSHANVASRAVISRSLKSNGATRKTRTVTRPIVPTRQPSPQKATGKYVYCIIRAGNQSTYGPIGLGAEPADVYTIARGDLAAVVSDAPLEVLDPTRDNVLAHQRVNETVMKQDTVLPMSFGTVFKTHDDVVELLRSASDAFSDVLNKMEAKLEFGLKVVWDRDAIIRAIEQEDEDIRRVKAELQARKGSTYFARMQYGRLVDAALQAKSERYVADIFAALRRGVGCRALEQADWRADDSQCRVPGEPARCARVRSLRQGAR